MKTTIIKLITLCFLLFLFSACGDVSKMKTVAEDTPDEKLLEYNNTSAIVFPNASIIFSETSLSQHTHFVAQLRWTNDSIDEISFNELFTTFQATQIQNSDYQSGVPISRIENTLADQKIKPQESQELTIQFQLNNQKDPVYFTMITTDGIEKHQDFSLQ
ncbi:DUF5067 domain-containing protein [Enterococcus sp. AZ109]|uniref:DUF5067 domain-containing protein n=1 Tax=Enterococcus sp. AZ109 TaxID=2774634 RepID=UPI003F274F05